MWRETDFSATSLPPLFLVPPPFLSLSSASEDRPAVGSMHSGQRLSGQLLPFSLFFSCTCHVGGNPLTDQLTHTFSSTCKLVSLQTPGGSSASDWTRGPPRGGQEERLCPYLSLASALAECGLGMAPGLRGGRRVSDNSPPISENRTLGLCSRETRISTRILGRTDFGFGMPLYQVKRQSLGECVL